MAAGWLILYDDLDVIFEETMKYSEAAYILENRKKAIEITDEIKDILENKIDLETKEKVDALLEQLLSEVLG
jgi:predicted nucleotidyltransferase